MTMPGVPVVFAGDEFGMTGADGEASRTPMPWSRRDEPALAEVFETYRTLVGLRRAHPVLGAGGMRWLHVDDETVVFVRESAEESVLVLATRGGADVELAPGSLAGAADAEELYGDATLATASDGAVALAADGPAFAAWSLPGVRVPRA
jgi:alpha-glucosidase